MLVLVVRDWMCEYEPTQVCGQVCTKVDFFFFFSYNVTLHFTDSLNKSTPHVQCFKIFSAVMHQVKKTFFCFCITLFSQQQGKVIHF